MCCKSRAPRLSQALPCSAGATAGATEVHLKGFFLLRESFGTNWSSGGPGGPRGESQREAGEDKEACMAFAPTAPPTDPHSQDGAPNAAAQHGSLGPTA